jgi:hypothetical protein
MTHWWLLSTLCWKKTDTKVRKLQMKQTYQHLFSGFWPKLCVRDKSLPGGSHTSWQKNTKQLTRGFQRNSSSSSAQQQQQHHSPWWTSASSIPEELLRHYETAGGHFMDRTVAVDETWIEGFEPELNHQSSHWKLLTCPCPKKCSC